MQQLAVLPSLWWALLLVPIVSIAWYRPVWLIAALFVAGAVWASFRAGLILDQALPPELEGRNLTVEGHIADIPELADFGQRFELDVTGARAEGIAVAIPSHILLTLRDSGLPLRAGERWRFTARLTRPRALQNPGSFDYEAHLFRNRIRARGNVRAEPLPERLSRDDSPRYAVDRLRQDLGERIQARLSDYDTAGIVVALANGDARSISEPQWDVFRRTGTLHLVAISGLHITLIGGVAFFLIRWFWALPGSTVLRLPAQVAGAVGGMAAASGYAALAGFVIPAQRALIMLAVAMAALMWRRRARPTQVLAVALFLVLFYDPLAVMAPGFWLSFAAVAVIVFIGVGEEGGSPWWRKWGYLQWAIALGMLPLGLLLFQQVSLSAPLANMIAVPVFDLLAVPCTLAGIVALAWLPEPVAGWCFRAAAQLLHLLWPLLEWLGRSEAVIWSQPHPPLWTVACGHIGAGLLLAPRGFPARWIGAVWVLPMLLLRPPAPAAGEVWFTLLDVGEGLSAVVRTEHHTLVFDAGPRFGPGFDTGEAVVVPYLRESGAGPVDTLVVSHGDNDHIGGVESLRQNWRVGHVLTSVPERLAGAEPCAAGENWEWDGVAFVVLDPPRDHHGQHNNASCVLLVRGPHGSVLLTGDIEAGAERRLVGRHASELGADILVAPHHGSRTSSTDEFVAAVQPKYVLFSVGYRNRHHHPHPDVRACYAENGARLLETPATGAAEFRLRPAGMELVNYRERARRYWFAH